MQNFELLVSDQAYADVVAKTFETFKLDLSLCSPSSLKMTEYKFSRLLSAVFRALPERFVKSGELRFAIQAASIVEKTRVFDEYQQATIAIYPPFPSQPLAIYRAKIYTDTFIIDPVHDIEEGNIDQSKIDIQNTDVLVVDNDKVIRLIFQQYFKKINPSLKFDLLEDGTDVMNLFSNNGHHFTPPRLIFMDLQMVTLNGDVATSQIRWFEKKFHLPRCRIVLMTAHCSEIVSDLEKIGFDKCINKPIRILDIQNELSALHLSESNPQIEEPALISPSPSGI